MKMMEQQAEAATNVQLNSGFENNVQCGATTLSNFAVSVRRELMRVFDLDGIRARLDKSKSTGAPRTPADLQLWDDFKNQGFARTLAAVHALCRLDVLVKVQLSIVARYVHHDAQGGPGALKAGVAEQVSKAYFAVAEYAQGEGVTGMCARLLATVETVMRRWSMGDLCAKDDLVASLQEIERLFDAAEHAQSAGGGGDSLLLRSLLKGEGDMAALVAAFTAIDTDSVPGPGPEEGKEERPPGPRSMEQLVAERQRSKRITPEEATRLGRGRLAEMLAETRAVMQSRSVREAIRRSVERGMAIVHQQLELAFKPKTTQTGTGPESSTSASPRIPFANAMIRMTKVFGSLLPPPEELAGSPLLAALNAAQDTRDLCAVVFFPTLDYPKAVAPLELPGGAGMDPMERMLMQSMMNQSGGGLPGAGPHPDHKQMEQLLSALANPGAGAAFSPGGLPGGDMQAMLGAMLGGAGGTGPDPGAQQMDAMMRALMGAQHAHGPGAHPGPMQLDALVNQLAGGPEAARALRGLPSGLGI